MRKFIDIAALMESVSFHPSVLRVEGDHKIIDYPNGIQHEERTCKYCDGTGKDDYYPDGACEPCDGSGKTVEEVVNCPEIRFNYMDVEVLCKLVGVDFDQHGWIPPEELPALKARIAHILTSRDTSEYQTPNVDFKAPQQVSWDGETTGGAHIIGRGIDHDDVKRRCERMLHIIDWAIEHKTGVSWS